MKKLFLLFGVLVSILSSCQSTKQVESTILPLDFSVNGGKTIDGYWESYFNTKDTSYLDQIIAYTTAEDQMINELNVLYTEGDLNEDWIAYLELNNVNGKLYSKYDMDYITGFLLTSNDEQSKENMRVLYSCFPEEFYIRNLVKTAAYWSLASNAKQIEDVYIYLKEKLPEVSLKTIQVFKEMYNINTHDPCVLEVENSSMCDSNGFGASSIFYFYEDGTWEEVFHQRAKNSKGNVFVADVIESKGTYEGEPETDISLELTITHERYWQALDREIESLGELGKKRFYNEDFSPLPVLESPKYQTLEY